MKKLFYLIIGLFVLASCKENERLIYESGHKIYFGGVSATADSITVSLAGKPNGYEYNVKVRLIGQIPETDKKFHVEIVPEKTTAKESIHYKALDDYYTFPAGQSEATFPITFYNQDPILEKENLILVLRLTPTEDVETAFEDRIQIRIRISNILKVPEGLDFLGDLLAFNGLFGEYSKVKHTLILDIVGHDFWDKGESIFNQKAYYVPYARVLYVYIRDNEVYDENGKRIELWEIE